MKKIISTLGSYFLDFVYPPICVACKSKMSENSTALCFECLWNLPRNTNLLIHNDSPENKFWGRVKTNGVFSFLQFSKGGSVQNILHAMKYSNLPQLAFDMGVMCGKALLPQEGFRTADLVVPIPLHPSRWRERGYNQAERIAAGVAAAMELPLLADGLVRKRHTPTQTKRGGRLNRMRNLENVFEVGPLAYQVSGKRILLVDDVLTTGATLEAAAACLWRVHPEEIYLVTLAGVSGR